MSWRKLSRKIESKGQTAARAASLADFHRRRNETQSQYFTPEWVAKGIWTVFSPIIRECKAAGITRFSVLDNAIGSGRLLEGAPIEDLELFGLDVDSKCINALCTDAAASDLSYHFESGGMEDLTTSGFHFSVINPPFSIQLESPNLTPYICNKFGRFGQSSSALSHEYALEQALEAAIITAAVLPVSMDSYCRSKDTLKAVVYLPRNTFSSEGANVATAIYFFTRGKSDHIQSIDYVSDDDWPQLQVNPGFLMHRTNPLFKLSGIDLTEPVITLPVTDNPRVELHHHNRQIVIKYHCGLIQAKVANGLLRDLAVGIRLPKSVKYEGEGQLLVDVLLLQENPDQQLDLLADRINALGGEAVISPTLSGYYKKLIKRHERAVTPMYRMIKNKGPDRIEIKAKLRTLLEPGNFNSPSIRKGQILNAIPGGGEYTIKLDGQSVTLRRDEVLNRFELLGDSDVAANDSEWKLLYPGLNSSFPVIAHQHLQRISAAGIEWLAPFQRNSLVEGLVAPYGYLGAWEQGSGKARYALALAMMHEGKNMIAVESGLMPEMIIEIKKLGLANSLWKILRNGDNPTAKINLVSYATLRQGFRISVQKTITKGIEKLDVTKEKIVRSNAQRWRRQINTLICDEGGLLANLNTQQTRAVKSLSARKLIVLDGTPQRNYPRDLLPLCVASAGNGVSHQPHGVRGKAYLEPRLLDSANQTHRGEDVFYDNHVVTQWVTNEFREEMQSGGKREVPKINNLGLFRTWLAPNIQRRLRSEPELSIFKNCPDPERENYTVQWDQQHLAHYLKIATEFANWYRNAHADTTRAINLVSVLARIGAVQRAANSPHVRSKSSMGTYSAITSKQRFAIDRVNHWIAKGRKVILYADSPEVLKRLHILLSEQGIYSVLFTGKQDIQKRAKALNDEFRFGSAPVLLSSWVGQRGLNLEQAGAVIFYERSWSSTVEEQAIYRTQRPSQTMRVVVEYLHLAGSIDEYCAQLVEWKQRAADAGLDFGDQCGEEEEFLHLDTLLHRFCDDVLKMSIHEAKELLVA